MRSFIRSHVLVATITAFAVVGATTADGAVGALVVGAQAAQRFTIVDLGTLGGSRSVASAVNNSGQVVGFSYAADGRAHAFSWTKQGGMIDLTLPGASSPGSGNVSLAYAVNNRGQVVGESYAADGRVHAFSWTAQGGFIDLGPGWANGVNDSGQVVGVSTARGFGLRRAFSWTQEGGMVDLGTLGGEWSRTAEPGGGVNNSGQVVGYSSLTSGSDFPHHAFSWTQENGLVDLGTLDGTSSRAYAVNNSGQVVGIAFDLSSYQHAFTWTQEEGMVDLGRGGSVAVNDRGQVVGWSSTGDSPALPFRAFSWTQENGMVDLGTLGGGASSTAVAVNNRGQVVGYGYTANGQIHAFSWTRQGGMIDLGSGTAYAVNDRGQVVGQSFANGFESAVLWEPSGS